MISFQQIGAEQVLIFLKGKPEKLQGGMQRAFARIAIRLQKYIVTQKLSGDPLKRHSGKLAASVIQRVENSGTKISAIVQAGSLAPYAFVHEYGGTFQIPEHLSVSRLGRSFTVHAHSATFPERSFMRTSLEENVDMYLAEVSKAIGESLK